MTGASRAVAVASVGEPSTRRRGGTDGAPRWEVRRARGSPRYTTPLDEVPVVRAVD